MEMEIEMEIERERERERRKNKQAIVSNQARCLKMSSTMSDKNILQPMVSVLAWAATASIIVFFCLSANPVVRSSVISAWSNSTNMQTTSTPTEEAIFEGLVPLLSRAATDDRTVILTSINEAWAAQNSLLDVFLESFHVGENIKHLLDHLIIVCLDPMAYDRCNSLHPHCFFLKVEGFNLSSFKIYMSEDYIELVWTKLKFQRRILELGYNFIFTDVDVLWFRNPFRYISVYSDLTISCDRFSGDPDNLFNYPNTGFIYVKSTKKTVQVLKYWHEARGRFNSTHEQNIFNLVKEDMVNQFQVKIRYMDTAYWSTFCTYGKDLNKICSMHASCCVGLEAKIHDLRSLLDDWKNYTALSVEEKKIGNFTWRVPGRCIR